MKLTVFSPILFFIFICVACESRNQIQHFPKDIQADFIVDKRIDVYINQLGDNNNNVRQDAISSLIKIANESNLSRNNVVGRLTYRFDSFRGDKQNRISRAQLDELDSYLKLFLELNAVEALDVLVKYINSKEAVATNRDIMMEAVAYFGEDAIPSLKRGLNNADDEIRGRSALTLSILKFKRNREEGIQQAVEILEEAKETETNKYVVNCINQSVLTLNQRKLPNYPLENY